VELESTDADDKMPAMLLAAARAAELTDERGEESTERDEDSFLELRGRDPASSFLVAPTTFSFSSATYRLHQSGMRGWSV
jgi:hypothetical protein